MGSIIILDENTANRIAAGEVIERPSSVVKELVENSIDAGATAITVEIRKGGIEYIRVTDDGSGIAEDDVLMAFERHATSKLRDSEGLACISTLGFRGEALSSIASVSRVGITTKTADAGYGMRLDVSAGTVNKHEKTGCPEGTTIVVEKLFYNTPARYKFLRKDSTEARYVTETLNRAALGTPNVSFRLVSNGREVLHTPGNNDLLSTIFSIHGRETAQKCIGFDEQFESVRVEGFVGSPETARSNRSAQYFYVNDRYIKSSMMNSAVDEAFKTFVMKGRYPFTVVKVGISSGLVDVNVHPAKLQVRFSNEQDIFRTIFHGIRNALSKNISIKKDFSDSVLSSSDKTEYKKYVTEVQQPMKLFSSFKETAEKKYDHYERDILLNSEYIGQVLNTYIILQHGDRLYVMDQHAAHERVMYENLKKKHLKGENLSQQLVSPVVVELSNSEFQFLEEKNDILIKTGYNYEIFGNNSIVLRTVPYTGTGGNIKGDFISLIEHLKGCDNKCTNDMTEEALYRTACTAAVKAGKTMNASESEHLVKQVAAMENPFTCPHGRPTLISIDKSELERRFKRK